MPPARSQKYRLILACAVVVTAVAATATALTRPATETAAGATPGLYCYEADGFRYEYHAPTGCEGLYDVRSAPGVDDDVLHRHRDVAARCRRALERKLGVASLDSLSAEYADTIRRLHALGYL